MYKVSFNRGLSNCKERKHRRKMERREQSQRHIKEIVSLQRSLRHPVSNNYNAARRTPKNSYYGR